MDFPYSSSECFCFFDLQMDDSWFTVEPEQPPVDDVSQCCVSLSDRNASQKGRTSRRGSCEACMNTDWYSPSCDVTALSSLAESLYRPNQAGPDDCSMVLPNYNPAQFVSLRCHDEIPVLTPSKIDHTQRLTQTSTTSGAAFDPYIEDYKTHARKRQCRLLRLQHEFKWLPALDIADLGFDDTDLDAGVTGIACSTNRSLNVYAMDADHSQAFLSGLSGQQLVNVTLNSSAVFIVDLQVNITDMSCVLLMFTRYRRAD